MSLRQQIDTDLIQAVKKKDDLAVLTLRQVKNALANAEIANNRQELDDSGIVKVIKSEVKKRKESIELYKKGNRDELAQKEQQEIDILSDYLPAEMSEDKIRGEVKAIIAAVGAQGPQDTGKVMGAVMSKLGDQADGGVVSKIVKEELSG